MPERIYTSAGDGKPEALNETPFPTEDELQALIAEHPQLLDGAQIRPGDARRWFLVTREKGIAASAGAAARWAVDHVIIDQDAVPNIEFRVAEPLARGPATPVGQPGSRDATTPRVQA